MLSTKLQKSCVATIFLKLNKKYGSKISLIGKVSRGAYVLVFDERYCLHLQKANGFSSSVLGRPCSCYTLPWLRVYM